MRAADYGRLDGLTMKEGLDGVKGSSAEIGVTQSLDVIFREDWHAISLLQFGEFKRDAVPQDERVSLLTHLDGPFLGFDHDGIERPVELIVFHCVVIQLFLLFLS
jgi:hypothetical protein